MEPEEFLGVLDLPVSPEVMSLATISVPAGVCLEEIILPASAISYLGDIDFTFLLDGDELWSGRGQNGGLTIKIPPSSSFSESPRSIMVLAMPQGIGLPFALTPMEITIGVKGKQGECAYVVDIDPDGKFDDFFLEEWV